MDYSFTANIEKLLDEIAKGDKVWNIVVSEVYNAFNPKVEKLEIKLKEDNKNRSVDKFKNGKILGNHPVYDKPIYVYNSKYGPTLCIKFSDKKDDIYTNFRGKIDNMTLKKALTLLVYPKIVGNYNNYDIKIQKKKNIYITYNNTNYSIDNYNKFNPNDMIDPETIDYDNSVKIIKYYENTKSKEKRFTNDIVVKKAHTYYIKYKGKDNIPLPKKFKDDISELTLDDCCDIVKNYLINPKKKTAKPKKIIPKKDKKTSKPKKDKKTSNK